MQKLSSVLLSIAVVGLVLLVGLPLLGEIPYPAGKIILLVAGLSLVIFWLENLIDACARTFDSPATKVGWIVCVLTGIAGALVYILVGRPTGRRGQ